MLERRSPLGHDTGSSQLMKQFSIMSSVFSQSQAQVRMEWGPFGADVASPAIDIAVVVDVLSFTTSLSVAIDAGAEVFPYRWNSESAEEFADLHSATLAVSRSRAHRGQVSLSPVTIRAATDLIRLVLPSPSGSSLSFQLADTGAVVVGACLRNRMATARWLTDRLEGPDVVIAVIAAGERWPDGSLRPAVEDLWGAGAVIDSLQDALTTSFSREAEASAAAFRNVQSDIGPALMECSSGQELIAAGFIDDIAVAAELDKSENVPVLKDGKFCNSVPS